MKTILSPAAAMAAIAVVFSLSSCKKDMETPTFPILPGDLSSFESEYAPEIQTFTIDAGATAQITGSQGTKVIFSPNSLLTQNNQPVTGNVTVELTEVYSKTDMMMGKVSTTTTDGKWLESAGMIDIKAKQGSEELKLGPGKSIHVQMPVKTSVNDSMQVFYGSSTGETVEWTLADSSNVTTVSDTMGYIYSFLSNNLTWINCDYFNNYPDPKFHVKGIVPEGFTDSISGCIIFKDELAVADLSLDKTELKCNYSLPVGLEFYFVAYSKLGDQFYGCIQPATVTADIADTLQMKPMEDKDFISQVKDL